MKQQTHDIEMTLRCVCNDPFHIVHLGFDKTTEFRDGHSWPPELYISFRAYYGSIWKRIKKAWGILWAGWVDAYPDSEIVGLDEIESIRDFCDRCLAAEKGEK